MADVSVCSWDRIHLELAPVVLLRPECRCEYKNGKCKCTTKLKKCFPLSSDLFCVSLSFLPPQESSCWWDNNPRLALSNYTKTVIIIIFIAIFENWNIRKTGLKINRKKVDKLSSTVASAWTALIHVDIRNIFLEVKTVLLSDYICRFCLLFLKAFN